MFLLYFKYSLPICRVVSQNAFIKMMTIGLLVAHWKFRYYSLGHHGGVPSSRHEIFKNNHQLIY